MYFDDSKAHIFVEIKEAKDVANTFVCIASKFVEMTGVQPHEVVFLRPGSLSRSRFSEIQRQKTFKNYVQHLMYGDFDLSTVLSHIFRKPIRTITLS